VNDHGPAGILYNLVQSQISDSATLAEVETLVQTSAMTCGIAEDAVVEVMTRFRAELNPEESETPPPRLLVDWGDLPRVGYQVRPEFSLICPEYPSRPDVIVRVDQQLDHDDTDRSRRPHSEDQGLWTFHVPFTMTTDGMDCRPGHYLVDVEVFFREAPAALPRFFRCRLRLNVPDANAADGGVLEIDGDGQSMINLQGHNLKQFSKVVLKGGADSVINLQDAIGGAADENETGDDPQDVATTFEYDLKVDTEKQKRLPTVSEQSQKRAYLNAAGFFFEDGRRTLIFTQPRLSFGRSRAPVNDVVIRFLPSSDENNKHSRNISRTHFLLEVTPDGLEFIDQSSKGMQVDIDIVRERKSVTVGHGPVHVPVDLGLPGTVEEEFHLEMATFTPDRNSEKSDLNFWDELYCELIGGHLSRLARSGLDLLLDAVKFDRIENLEGEESYVLLMRELLIGGSPNRCGLLLKESAPEPQAKLLHMDRSFWLEVLPDAADVQIDGEPIAPATLTHLVPGMTIQFGDETVRFDKPTQLYLD
jgi:hypothetical protein